MTWHIQTSRIKTTFLEDPETDLKTLAENRKDMIPAIIADQYCREILRVTAEAPKSSMEINLETRIPISTVYRRVQILCDAGLVETSGTISEDGKKFFLYKSTIKEIYLKFDGSLQITVNY